jgi:hypothetical protein
MPAQKKRGPATNTVNGPSDGVLRRHASHIPSGPEQQQRSLAVSDGTTAVGTVEVRDSCFVALDTDGIVVGKFGTLRAAVRALPGGAP